MIDGWLIAYLQDTLGANFKLQIDLFGVKNNFCSFKAIYDGIIVIVKASQTLREKKYVKVTI